MRTFLLLLMILSLLSCNRLSHQEKEIRDNLKKAVNLRTIKNVQKKETGIKFDDFRKKYKFIYLVYLKNSCSPCYSTYIRWQKEIPTISKSEDFTVLFIINGSSYDEFIREAQKEGLERDSFHTFMDPNDTFINGNKDIPQSIIKSALLIDDKNQIVLIGSPFSTPEMTNIFKAICSSKEETPLNTKK